mmetsp:Transcript_10009/g.37359  ORF Transcript_10009/g.37359 Transcript_10009/m.37359 type:complete len:85 (+) Transcript_10009:515-769(+)
MGGHVWRTSLQGAFVGRFSFVASSVNKPPAQSHPTFLWSLCGLKAFLSFHPRTISTFSPQQHFLTTFSHIDPPHIHILMVQLRI